MACPLKKATDSVLTHSQVIQNAKLSLLKMTSPSNHPAKCIEKIPNKQVQAQKSAVFQIKTDKNKGPFPLYGHHDRYKPAKVLGLLFQGVFNGES